MYFFFLLSMSISYRSNDTRFMRFYVLLENCWHEDVEHARTCRNFMALISTKLKKEKKMYKTLTELWKFIVLAAETVAGCELNCICGISVRLRILGRV